MHPDRRISRKLGTMVAGMTCLVMGWPAGFPGGARGDEPSARAIVDRALQAHGGAMKIAQYPMATWTEKGTYFGMGQGIPYHGEYASHGPSRFRMNILGAFQMVLDGDKGWVKRGDAVRLMTSDELQEQRLAVHTGWVMTLAPLTDPTYQVASLGSGEIQGRPVQAVKVSRVGWRDVTLWFDRETHRLLKAAAIVKSPEMNQKEVLEEVFLEQLQEVNGVQVPRKVTIVRGGVKFVEANLNNFQLAEKADDAQFAMP